MMIRKIQIVALAMLSAVVAQAQQTVSLAGAWVPLRDDCGRLGASGAFSKFGTHEVLIVGYNKDFREK